MSEYTVNASISVPEVNACTYPQGPRGTGIQSVSQNKDVITVTLDDGRQFSVTFPDWWFGTRNEYNLLTQEERDSFYLHFIEEGS